MKKWIEAARLRTLPLSISGIFVGSFYALSQNYFNGWIFTFAILTTLGLQILSNFANDYGDGIKGTDNDDRIGPQRALQSGAITPIQMKNAIVITSILTFVIALMLIYLSFGKENFFYSLLFIVLGLASIVAALKYTMGKSAYGYRGLGDVFVFLFFGLLSVLGSYFLYSKFFDCLLMLPACSIGFMSAAVLNLNNMRDENSDRASNKNTLVVKFGGQRAKIYHYVLLFLAMVLLVVFAVASSFEIQQYLFVLGFLPFLKHISRISKYTNPKDYDPELKFVAMGTFVVSVLLSISMNV